MNIEQLLLIKLMEECAEVQQVCAKALRFGLTETCPDLPLNNGERIKEELLDVFAVLQVLREGGILDLTDYVSSKDIPTRLERINKYMDYSRELGILE